MSYPATKNMGLGFLVFHVICNILLLIVIFILSPEIFIPFSTSHPPPIPDDVDTPDLSPTPFQVYQSRGFFYLVSLLLFIALNTL